MPIIDTHVHYNLEPLYQNWRQHWHKAQEHGVEHSIVVGTNLETSQRALEIADQEPNLWAAIGYHPNAAAELDIDKLEKLFTDSEKIVAVGETGLDYFRLTGSEADQTTIKNVQKESFKHHIELALQYRKVLIVHVRDQQTPEEPTPGNAYWDALELLTQYYPQVEKSDTTDPTDPYDNALDLIQNPRGFILHCISGPKSYVETALTHGAYLGVAGNCTYKNADHLRELIKLTPPSRLLLETDAPYLPPQGYRGQTCEPWMISETARLVLE